MVNSAAASSGSSTGTYMGVWRLHRVTRLMPRVEIKRSLSFILQLTVAVVSPPPKQMKHIAIALAGMLAAASASEFTNLNFELATLQPTGGNEDPALAFPGWTVGIGYVLYNSSSIGAAAEVLIGPAPPTFIAPLEGLYSAWLQKGQDPPFSTASLSQIGMVPADAHWLTFLVGLAQNFRVTLDDTVIPVFPIGNGRLAGDVSAFAGQEAELKFANYFVSAPDFASLYFDDVTFSPTPEPSVVGLLIASALLLTRRQLPRPLMTRR